MENEVLCVKCRVGKVYKKCLCFKCFSWVRRQVARGRAKWEQFAPMRQVEFYGRGLNEY